MTTTTHELAEAKNKASEKHYRIPEYSVRSDENDYLVEVAIPGASKDDVEIGIDDGVLTVTAHRKHDVPESWKVLNRELDTSDYRLKLELNAPIDIDRIKGKAENGILTLTLPIREAAKPRVIKVD